MDKCDEMCNPRSILSQISISESKLDINSFSMFQFQSQHLPCPSDFWVRPRFFGRVWPPASRATSGALVVPVEQFPACGRGASAGSWHLEPCPGAVWPAS